VLAGGAFRLAGKGIFLDFALIIVYGRRAIGVGCGPRLLSIEPADCQKDGRSTGSGM